MFRLRHLDWLIDAAHAHCLCKICQTAVPLHVRPPICRHRITLGGAMPLTRHVERHFTSGETVRDIVIGMSDGLTVPFALAAGLSGAIESTSIVITAGLAEIAAGSIAMGLGGYLAARSDAEHYASERRREEAEVRDIPVAEAKEVTDVFGSYGVSAEAAAPVVRALQEQPQAWIDFMMRFELGLEKPDPKRALVSASTIAAAYIAGGLIPLAPYFIFAAAARALAVSVAFTLLALFVFGYVKGHFTGARPIRSALQTTLVGGLAAAAAFAIARAIS
jgi:vacuolar iron transporter family protein